MVPAASLLESQIVAVGTAIQGVKDQFDKFPLEVVQGCPPLQFLAQTMKDFVAGPAVFPIPFTGVTATVQIEKLVQDLQELLSLRTELNLVKQILIDKINELDIITEWLRWAQQQLQP